MLYRLDYSPSLFYYLVYSESILTVDEYIRQNHSSVTVSDVGDSEGANLHLVLDEERLCPVRDFDHITPEISHSSADGLVLNYDSFASLKLATAGPDVLTLSPQLGRIAPTLQINLGLAALRHGAIKTGRTLVHSSAFTAKGKGVLILGDSRAGKSTFAVSAGLYGAQILSDDMVLIEYDEPVGCPMAYAARKHFTLRRDIAESNPALATNEMDRFVTDDGEVKYMIRRDSNMLCTTASMRVDHLLFCRGFSDSGETKVTRLSSAEFFALLLKCLHPMFGKNFKAFGAEHSNILALVKRLHVECTGYSIKIGADILTKPAEAVDNLVSQLSKH